MTYHFEAVTYIGKPPPRFKSPEISREWTDKEIEKLTDSIAEDEAASYVLAMRAKSSKRMLDVLLEGKRKKRS